VSKHKAPSESQVSTSRLALTCARAAALAIATVVTCAVLVAAGCGRQPSPTAPDVTSPPQPATQTHIRGEVTDRVRRPLAGALIGVMDGPLAGMTTLTNDAGKFELTGTAAGAVTIRASRDGFETRSEVLSWQTPIRTARVEVQFWLDTIEPSIGLEPGDYTLTIAIDLTSARNHSGIPQAPCTGFPAELASRSYRVTIAQESSLVPVYNRFVRPENATLRWGIGFAVAGRFVGFEMDDGIPEDLPGFRFLNINGAAPTTVCN
jgi:hypothetical protein